MGFLLVEDKIWGKTEGNLHISAVCSAGMQAGAPWTLDLESIPECHRVNITLFFYIAIAGLPLYLVQCLMEH